MWNLKNKINERGQTKQKYTRRHRKQIDGHQMGEWLEGWVKKGKGIKKYKLTVIKNSHWLVTYNIGNRISNIATVLVIMLYT